MSEFGERDVASSAIAQYTTTIAHVDANVDVLAP
jgi:hypothetical protein